jgi:autotransporter-associated beta strand protein
MDVDRGVIDRNWCGVCRNEMNSGMSGRCKAIDPSRSENGARQPAITAIAVFAAARCFAAALAIMLLAGEAAWADCTPAAANNVAATCTGTTLNQGGGAPGTSADVYGYGTGTQTGVTVTIDSNATVTGTDQAINIVDGTIINGAGATITGGWGIRAATGSINLTNSGIVAGTSPATSYGIFVYTDATVTNNAGASITSRGTAIRGSQGFVNVINSGSITGTGTQSSAIRAGTYATVTNNAGASITGGVYGIYANAGGSSVINAGTISGSTAAIRFSGTGNTLTLAPGSAITGNVLGTGSDTFQLGGSGAATFDVSRIDPAGQYQGFGTFNKIGSSTWTLTGTSSFAGPVTVNGGRLNVDGDIRSMSGVAVNAGGTLGGSGFVGNTLVTSGTFAPGTPGTALTVTGTLGLDAASTYAVNVTPSAASSANVSGVATLGGATLNAAFAPGSYVSRQYIILTAGSLGGSTFGALVNTNKPASISDTLSYDATHAYLNVSLNFSTPAANTLNGNQQAVANTVVNFFNTTGGIPFAFAALSAGGLAQASGESAVGSQQTTFNAMGQFMGLLTDPFIGGRDDGMGAGGNSTGYAESDALAYAAKRNPNDAPAAISRKAPPMVAPSLDQRWSVWSAGFGGSQTTDGNAALGSNSATSRIYGGAVGLDYRISPATIAGFALAGGGTNFSVANSGSGRSDLFQAGAFVRHNVGAAYLTAALAYGWQDITTDRTVTVAGVDRLRAEFNANAFSGRIEGGYRFVVPAIGGVGITPYAAGQFASFELPNYAETVVSGANTFALAYGSKSVTGTRSELGLRTDKSWAMPDSILTLRGRLGWAHDFNPDRSIAATFQTLPGASFVVNGAAQASDSALTTASLERKWINGFSLAATFEGEFSDVTRSYAGKGVARYQW